MRKLSRFHVMGLCGVAVIVLVFAQVGSAKTQSKTVKAVGHPVWTLAMDWPRIAYASGKNGNSETIHVWNVATGATSVIHGGQYGFAVHHVGQIAVTGKRVVWVRSQQFGNTELDRWLYTAPTGGSAHLLRRVLGYTDTGCSSQGPKLGGLAGSGSAVAVSMWNAGTDGSAPSNQRLALVTPTRLRTIATGADAIVSQSLDAGHIAVLPLPTVSGSPDDCGSSTLATSVPVYSTKGALLATIALPPVDSSALGYQVAIRGKRLVVLTFGSTSRPVQAWVTLTVYNWTTGALLHTWPVAIPRNPGEVNFSFSGKVAAVEGPFRLHLVDLDTGKDVTIARASHTLSRTALGPRGLVYAVNANKSGKLVFVPMAKLLQLVS